MPLRPKFFRPSLPPAPTFDPARVERRGFYNTARWRRLRAVFLVNNPLCADCMKEGRFVPAKVAHHVVERLDDPDRALDESNLEPLCNAHHTRRHKGKQT